VYKTEETVVVSLGPAMQLNTLAVGFLTGTLLQSVQQSHGGKTPQEKKKKEFAQMVLSKQLDQKNAFFWGNGS
jgi:hypothetical protein